MQSIKPSLPFWRLKYLHLSGPNMSINAFVGKYVSLETSLHIAVFIRLLFSYLCYIFIKHFRTQNIALFSTSSLLQGESGSKLLLYFKKDWWVNLPFSGLQSTHSLFLGLCRIFSKYLIFFGFLKPGCYQKFLLIRYFFFNIIQMAAIFYVCL